MQIDEVRELIVHHRDRTFLIDGATGRSLTYGELHTWAARLAAALRARGIGPGDRVALLLDNSPEFALLYFGCLYAGAVAVPVSPALSPAEVRFILRSSRARLLVCSPAMRELGEAEMEVSAPGAVWVVGHGGGADGEQGLDYGVPLPAPLPDAQLLPQESADAVFSINFTSGTTSLPKGVVHRVGALLGNARAFNEMMGIGAGHRFVHVFPMAYMAGFLNTLLCPFVAGGSVVLGGAFDARVALAFWPLVARYSVNAMWLAPTMLAILQRVDRDTTGREFCRSVQPLVCVGTAPLPGKLKLDFEGRYGVELMESYGLSELLLVSANTPRAPRTPASVGRLVPGVEVEIRGGEGVDSSRGEGDIWVRTPFALAGYLDYETGKSEPADPWFSTGDVGRLDDAGDLFITGRKKDLIIRGGVNVSPRAVEETLLLHDAVQEAAVVGLPHEVYGEEVAAAVRLHAGRDLAQEQASLQAFCRERLGPAAVPTRFVGVTDFPRSVSGKVQKHELRRQMAGSA